MNIRAATPPELLALARYVGFYPTSQAKGVVAVDGHGHVRGGVAFDGWTESSATVHMAVETPIAWRSLLPEAMRYAFEQAGRRVLVGTVRESNRLSRRVTEHIGFRLLARLEDGAARGEALLIYHLRPEWCRQFLTSRKEAA